MARGVRWLATLGLLLLPLSAGGEAPGGAPVVLGDRTLFYVHERVLSFLPEARAAAISARLRRLARDPLTRLDAISVQDGDTTTDIVAGDLVIMSVTDRDARVEGQTRQVLAEHDAQAIRVALAELRRQYTWRSLVVGVVLIVVATAILIAILLVFHRLFPRLYATIESWRGVRIRPLKFQTLEILRADQIAAALIALAKAVRVAAVLVLLYVYVPLVLSLLPWTRRLGASLTGSALDAVASLGRGVAAYVPNLVFVAVTAVVTHYLIRIVRGFFAQVARGTVRLGGFYPEWADPTFKLARLLIIAFAFVVVFPYLPGSASPAFRGVSIFLGVLLSLGSSSAVANMVAGVILVYMRAFRVGDRVRIGATTGDVVEKTLLVTRVRTIKNVDITIPNSAVLGSHIENFSSSGQGGVPLILHTRVTIGYGTPWRTVHALLLEAARGTPNVLAEPAPFVLQVALDDFYVAYEVNAFTGRPNEMARTYAELHQRIQDTFHRAGVEIMSPHYTQLRDGHPTTVPAEYLPKDYAPPAFRILETGREAQPAAPGAATGRPVSDAERA